MDLDQKKKSLLHGPKKKSISVIIYQEFLQVQPTTSTSSGLINPIYFLNSHILIWVSDYVISILLII